MKANDVASLYNDLEAAGVCIWIDGGWGVDALLGEETRAHSDLDIAIELKDVPRLRAHLASRGYAEVTRADSSAWMFVMADAAGRRVDVHAVVFNDAGEAVLGPAENGHAYPPGSLAGQGEIAGSKVRCVTAAAVVGFRSGFDPRAVDRHDVRLLCRRFGIPLPDAFRE
jgi:lincosamide nucleotidyltransferase A/C/D/E